MGVAEERYETAPPKGADEFLTEGMLTSPANINQNHGGDTMTDQSAPKVDWTQQKIIEEARRVRGSGSGFFVALYSICWEAFGYRIRDDHLSCHHEPPKGSSWEDLPPPGWRFPMEELTIGQVLDFFDAQQAGNPIINWHSQSDGPGAEIVIEDYNLAEAFRHEFRIHWDSPAVARARRQEDYLRAAGYR